MLAIADLDDIVGIANEGLGGSAGRNTPELQLCRAESSWHRWRSSHIQCIDFKSLCATKGVGFTIDLCLIAE
ncbi:hypothetical protein RA876_14865 [Rhodoferax antarcticus]|nr:hypothetical protein RA876_14865 [Rhodoferax antarcticus]